MTHAFVIPLRDFSTGKSRLRNAGLDATVIARELAIRIVNECRAHPTYVVTEDKAISTFARDMNVGVVTSNSKSLNEALARAFDDLRNKFERLTIVHADLATPDGLSAFASTAQCDEVDVTIATDHRGEGTNVLSLPTTQRFTFRYGPHSARAHEREVHRLGYRLSILRDSPWAMDIDEPNDYFLYVKRGGSIEPPR